MANGGVISLSYVVNNSEFNSKMADMKKNLQLLQTECRNAAKEINLYGANTQTLAKKQDTINQAIKQTEKIMAQYNQQLEKNKTALSNNQSELTKLASKKKELTKQYKDAVKTYGEESQEAQKLKGELSQVSSEYDKMKGKVEANKNNIQNYTAQLERQRSTLLDLQGQLQATNAEIERQGNKFLQASEKFASAGKALENAGGKISELGDQVQKAGAVIVTASTAMATLAANYESGLTKVNTLVGATKEEIQAYGEAVLEMSNNTGMAVGDATDALYNAISAGVDYGDSVQYINDVNKLAVGGFTDITNASNLMTQIFNIYGKTTADVTDISNKLFLVQKNGVTTVAELATNMGEAMTMGASYNVSLENILSSYASLTKQGRTAATAQTQLKSMIQELGDTGSNVGKILQEKTGKSFTTLMKEGNSLYDVLKIVKDSCQGNEDAFNNLWSSTEAGLSAMSLLSNEGEFFNQTLEDMANSAGLTDEAFNAIADTTEYKMKKSINELKNSFTKLGQSLLPFVDKASSGIEKLSKIISNLSPEVVTAVAKFGLLAVALGTGLKIVGSFTTVLGKGATALSTFFKIIADTKSLGSFTKVLGNSNIAVGGLISTVGKLSGALVSLGPAGVVGIAVAGIAGLVAAWNKFQDGLDESTEGFKTAANNLEDFDGRVRTSDSLLTKAFGKKIKIEFSAEFEQAREEVKQGYNDLNEALKNYYEEKWQIDHDGCEDEAEHQKHREENERKHKEELFKIQYGERKDLNEGKDKSMQNVRDYLVNDLQMSGIGAGNTQGEISSWMNEKIKIVEDGEQKIYEIQKNAYSQNRELTASEQEEINKITEETGKWRALFETGNAQDIFNAWEAEYIKEKTVLEENQKRREKYASDVKDTMWEANKSICSGIDEQIKKIQEADWIDEDTKAKEIERLQGQKAAVADFTEQFGNHMETNIKNGDSFEQATARSFEQICNDLENGKINAKEFGMTNEEYMAHAIDAMIEGGASADDLTYAIAQIPKDKRADVLAKVKGKDESEELKQAIDKLKDKNIYIRTYYETHGLSNANYHYENGVAVPNRETGGSVNKAGIYNTQEAGLELIDTASPSQSAYSLGKAARGELTYIPANSKVTNAAMTTLKMKNMVDEQVKSSVSLYIAEFKKELLAVMKGNNSNGDFIVNMSNPHFENKESEQQNISNIKRIIKSMK